MFPFPFSVLKHSVIVNLNESIGKKRVHINSINAKLPSYRNQFIVWAPFHKKLALYL